jgi:Icc-related predicted phosphoesterase
VKLLVFSDIHGDRVALERLVSTDADYYVAAGDLSTWGRGLEDCGAILQRRAERVHVLPGNMESTAQVEALCRKYGLNDFHGRSFEAGSYHVAGLGYSNPTPFGTPGEYSEEELAERLSPFSRLSPLVLICHCPPLGTPLDRVRDGAHAGSRAVKTFLDKHQPDYFFCGHIHEAHSVEAHIGRTLAVNVGKRGYLLELP